MNRGDIYRGPSGSLLRCEGLEGVPKGYGRFTARYADGSTESGTKRIYDVYWGYLYAGNQEETT